MLRGGAESIQSIVGTGNLSIKLQGGSSDRAQVELKAGTPVEAFSVGADGGWRVSAAGIAPVHAYLYFDGTHLFVACAPGAIVQLGAATVGTDWKPVAAPAVIKLGQVSLSVEESGTQPKPAAPARAGPGPVARPQPSAAPVARPRPSAAPAARPQAARPQPSAAPVARPQPSAAPSRQGPPVAGTPRAAPAPAARPARPGPPPLAPRATGPTPRPQPTAPRAGPKPVRPPGEVMAAAPKAAPQPGASDYDDSESPTQYQPMPDGFSEKTLPPQESPVGSPSEPPTRIHAPASTGLDEEVLSEEATRVIPAPSETPAVAPAQPTGGVPKRTMLGMAPPPPTSAELARGAAQYATPVAAPEPPKPERPKPPSQPPAGESATVVKPLEQFLAEAGGRSLPGDSPDTAKQPLMAPATAQPPGAVAPPWGSDPYAQTQPPFGQQQSAHAATAGAYPGARGEPPGYPAADANAYGAQQAAYAQHQPGAYGAQQPGAYGAQQPGAYGAQQPGAYGAQQPGAYGAQGAYAEQQAGAFGAQQAGAYGAPGGAGASGQYPQQQYPGASGTFGQSGAGYPQQQAWGQQPVQVQPGKGPLAAWKAMPFPRKLMFLMLPFGLIAFVIVFTDPPQPPPRTKGSAGASAKPAPSAAPSAQPAGSAALAPTGALPPSAEPTAQPPEPTAAKPEPSAAPPEPTAAPPEAPPQPTASAEPPLPKGEVSLARKAADAVANNEFAKAADLYDQLAKQHPDNPTYARAAEILRKKAKK